MTPSATTMRATVRELAVVFAGVLVAALVIGRLRASALTAAPEGLRAPLISALVSASLATLAFAGLRAAGASRLAWVMTAGFVLALVCSSAGAIAGQRIAPVGPPPMKFAAQPPARQKQVADLFVDRPQTWSLLTPSITIRPDHHIMIDVAADPVFAFLAFSKPQHFDADDLLVLEGQVESGGFTLGIWQADNWSAYTSIIEPGPFVTWVAVPRDGDYQIAIANISQVHVPTHVELSSLRLRQ